MSTPPSHASVPDSDAARPRRGAFVPETIAVLVLLWAVALLLQWRGHSFGTEFGSHHDEPAHYVTGLMVRDYVASALPGSPMEYAQDYYLHYPKVALGHWPPVFYVAQAGWTLPFGPSRSSVLVFLALVSALLGLAVHTVLRADFGRWGALATALATLTVPVVQEYSRVVMSDLLLALLSFLAVAFLGRYFVRPSWKTSVGFGVAAALAILSKASGGALAAVPVICLLLTARFDRLLRITFWVPAGIVLASAGPWYALAPSAMHQSAVPLEYMVAGAEWQPRLRFDWIPGLGRTVVGLAVIGAMVRVVVPLLRRRRVEGMWAAFAAHVIAVLGARAFTPLMSDPRHTLPVVPAIMVFACAGAAWLLGILPRVGTTAWKAPAAGIALVILVLSNVSGMPGKEPTGFASVAEDLLSDEEHADAVMLVSSDALGEGMFIAEVAMNEKRPTHVVLRASKALSASGWMGESYTSFFETRERLAEFLEGIPVGVLVIEEGACPELTHHQLLREMVRRPGSPWRHLGDYEGRFGPAAEERGISAWALESTAGRPAPDVEEIARMLEQAAASGSGGAVSGAGAPSSR